MTFIQLLHKRLVQLSLQTLSSIAVGMQKNKQKLLVFIKNISKLFLKIIKIKKMNVNDMSFAPAIEVDGAPRYFVLGWF